MSGENGNGAGTLKAFAQMYGWKKWTAVNDPALRSLVADKTAREDRLWALVVLRSWGHPSGPKKRAVDPNGQKHLKLSDLARELRVSKQTATRWGQALAAKNRLHVLDSGVYPVDDPTKPFELANGANSPRLLGQNEAKYKIYIEGWKTSHPTEAKRESELRAELKQLKRKKLAGYKIWLKSQTPGTNPENGPGLPSEPVPDSSGYSSTLPDSGAPSNKEEEDTDIPSSAAAASTVVESESREQTPPPAASDSSSLSESDQAKVAEALAESEHPEDGDVRNLIAACRKRDPAATGDEIAGVIRRVAPRWRGPGLALFLSVVPQRFPLKRKAAAATSPPRHGIEETSGPPDPAILAEIERMRDELRERGQG